MNKFKYFPLAVLMCVLSISIQSNAQMFTSADTPIANPATAFPFSSIINVPSSGTVTDIDVSLQLTVVTAGHYGGTYDLTATLVSPTGTSVDLIGRTQGNPVMGGSGGSYLFDDAAAVPFPLNAALPAPGTYRPNNPLSAFNGENVNGNWVLTISSQGHHGGVITTLVDWGFDLQTPSPSPSPIHRRSSTPTFFVVDTLAINSVMYSALPFGQAHLGAFRQAINTIGPGINARLFRARAGDNPIFADGFESGDTTSWQSSDANTGSSSLLRYLAFVGDENMSYKVALGLADPEVRTVEVNMVDTLSTQTGMNLNGQSLSGGLPYAMMGVPMMPMAGGAATVKIVEAAPSGKTVIEDSKAVIENEVWNRWELFVAGDFSFYDQDQLTDLMQGFDTDTYAGSVGLEYRALDWLNLGLAWSYLESDTNISGNLGDIDLEGNLISGYATAFWRQYWADILYSYGTFNNDLRRNTGLGGSARGDTDSDSHNIRLNFGRNFKVGSEIVTGPIAGVRYSMGDIDPYSETGGGRAAVDYDGSDFESMISRLGWQATHFRSANWGRLVSQAHLAWEHEYMPENGTVGASLQTSPFALVTGSNVRRVGGFSAEDEGAHPGTDWLSAGVGLRFELSSGVSVNADYEGVFFRSNSSQHYASAKLSYEWGAIIPSGRGGKAVSGKAVAYEAYDASSEPVADTEDPKPAPATKPEAEVAVVKKRSSGDFASWLNRKGR